MCFKYVVLLAQINTHIKKLYRLSLDIRNQFPITVTDRKFTFKLVNCVGACALAPVMLVDGKYYDGVTPDSAISILYDIAENKTVASKQ